MDSAYRQLHGARCLNPYCIGMGPRYRQTVQQGHPLAVPDILRESLRGGGFLMGSDQFESRAGAFHYNLGTAKTINGTVANAIQIHHKGFGDPVDSFWEKHFADTRIDCFLYCCGIICLSVTDGAKLLDISTMAPKILGRIPVG